MKYFGNKFKQWILDDELSKHKHSVKYNKFDKQDVEQCLYKNPNILLELKDQEIETPAELLEDTFFLLYKYHPILRSIHEMDPKFLVNRAIIQKLQNEKRFQELQTFCKLDKMYSTLALEKLTPELKELHDQVKKELEQAEELRQQMKELLNQMNNQEQIDSEEGMSLDAAAELFEQLSQQLQNSLDNANQKISVALPELNSTLEEISKDINELESFISSWGMSPGSPTTLSFNIKNDIVEKLRKSNFLKHALKYLGHFKSMVTEAKQSKLIQTCSVSNVTLGKEIQKLLPSEKIKFKHPNTKKLFLKDFQENKLFVYDVETKKSDEAGPIVILCDESGSMYGSKIYGAKALILVILELARNQKRPIAIVHFSSGHKSYIKYDLFLTDKDFTVDQILECIEYFDNGGTNFIEPLKLAQDIISKEVPEFKRADILLITDGEAPLTKDFIKEFNTWKEEFNVKLHSIIVNLGHSTGTSLTPISDKVDQISEFITESEETRSVFTSALQNLL